MAAASPRSAQRLFTTPANVQKRLSRARERLREQGRTLDSPPLEELASRLPSVHSVLYLMFNEGYLAADAEHPIRRELCEEACHLASVLAEHPTLATAETHALLGLMHLHVARLSARQDPAGGLLLLEEQDRSLWDQERIGTGLELLARSAVGQTFSRFHAEAGIAAQHCLAPSFAATRWSEIVSLYELLERLAPSPLHRLNKAVAVAEWQGARAGLAVLESATLPSWLAQSYLWNAVSSDLQRRGGNLDLARGHASRAFSAAPNEAIRRALRRRLISP